MDLDQWARKEHFEFFRTFDEPFFGVCVEADCTGTYARCQREQQSFFLFYLHQALAAANAVRPFRLRIEEGEVYVHDRVDVSPTISRTDGTFGYAYMEYDEDFERFAEAAEAEIGRGRGEDGLPQLPRERTSFTSPRCRGWTSPPCRTRGTSASRTVARRSLSEDDRRGERQAVDARVRARPPRAG